MLVGLDIMPVYTYLHAHFPWMRCTCFGDGVRTLIVVHEGEHIVFPTYILLARTVCIVQCAVEITTHQQVYLLRQRNQRTQVSKDRYLRTNRHLALRCVLLREVLHSELMHVIQRQVPLRIIARMSQLSRLYLVFLAHRERRCDTQRCEDSHFPIILLLSILDRNRYTQIVYRLTLVPAVNIHAMTVRTLAIRIRQAVPTGHGVIQAVVTAQMCVRGVVGEPQTCPYAPVLMEEIGVLYLQQRTERTVHTVGITKPVRVAKPVPQTSVAQPHVRLDIMTTTIRRIRTYGVHTLLLHAVFTKRHQRHRVGVITNLSVDNTYHAVYRLLLRRRLHRNRLGDNIRRTGLLSAVNNTNRVRLRPQH